MRARSLAAGLALAGLAAVTGCASTSGGSGDGSSGTDLSVVGFSVLEAANEPVFADFEKTDAGKDVTITTSYGASGDQSRAVKYGLPADVVTFSLAPDVTRLVDAGLVDPGWAQGHTHGMVTRSVVVFLVRKGNPKHVRTWDDLVRPGIQVLSPNPFISGGARWNVMAAYGAQLAAGRSAAQAEAYLEALLRHVVVQPKSAREMLQAFAGGKGDVALAYENEAITARRKGEAVDYVVPDATILIENPIAVVKRSRHAAQAQAFVDYLLTAPAQRIFAKHGYRPVDDTVAAENAATFPVPRALFTIADLGGWPEAMRRFFDRHGGIVARIDRSLGVATSG